MRRFSIRSLIAFVLVSAVGMAALRNANDLWAGMLLLLALAAIGVALMGAILLRAGERHWWAGFAFFGGGYLALAGAPWLGDTLRPQLGTTHLLGMLRQLMVASDAGALSNAEAKSLLLEEQNLAGAIANAKRLLRSPGDDPAVQVMTRRRQAIQRQLTETNSAGPSLEHFQSVGHSLFALLSGLVGGMIAARFGRRGRLATDIESPSHPPGRDQDPGEGGE